jgi:hypothetical protein
LESSMVTLKTLGGGAAVEKFEDVLRQVLDNILDPNTTLATRKITLTVSFKPDETRQISITDIDCKPTLAARKPFRTSLFVGKRNGVSMAEEPNPGQVSLKGFQAVKGGKE